MMNGQKVLVGIMSASMLMNQAAAVVHAESTETPAINIKLIDHQMTQYTKVPNVQGDFAYDQNVVTPPDEVFNLFGTAATGLCAKPGTPLTDRAEEQYFINVSGKMKETVRLSLEEIKKQTKNDMITKCSCGMSDAIFNSSIVGIPLKNVLQLADIDPDANTVTVKDGDGYGLPIPLELALENEAMLVYRIGEQDLPGTLQLWMPTATARYFTRNVMQIEVTREEQVPEMVPAQEAHRAKINITNKVDTIFNVGDTITFEGYADDFDVAIEAVEFSMDGGETWTSCSTEDATNDRWVYWYFGYTAQASGTYRLDVRARTAEGRVSPVAASVEFSVN